MHVPRSVEVLILGHPGFFFLMAVIAVERWPVEVLVYSLTVPVAMPALDVCHTFGGGAILDSFLSIAYENLFSKQ